LISAYVRIVEFLFKPFVDSGFSVQFFPKRMLDDAAASPQRRVVSKKLHSFIGANMGQIGFWRSQITGYAQPIG